jgi:hypothetical protein
MPSYISIILQIEAGSTSALMILVLSSLRRLRLINIVSAIRKLCAARSCWKTYLARAPNIQSFRISRRAKVPKKISTSTLGVQRSAGQWSCLTYTCRQSGYCVQLFDADHTYDSSIVFTLPASGTPVCRTLSASDLIDMVTLYCNT